MDVTPFASPPMPPNRTRDEAAELEGCRRGDRAALEAVFDREAPMLERQIRRLIGPAYDVEDLLQATFVEAISAFPKFRGEAAVSTWLTRIAVNVVQHRLRRKELMVLSPLELLPDVADGRPGLEQVTDARHHLRRIYEHLETLAPKKRIAFIMHVLEGHSIEVVAAMMGASRVTTRSRVFWARTALVARARRDPELKELVSKEGAP